MVTQAPNAQEALKYLFARCRDDFSLYCRVVHGWPAMSHHRVWHKHICDQEQERIIIVAPPASAKTTHVGVAFTSWMIGKNPGIHIGYVTNSAELAEAKSVTVRNTVAENTMYKLVFPHVVPDKWRSWGQAEWFVERDAASDPHPTFRAVGIEGGIIGYRLDLIIADDVCTLENMSTAHQRDIIFRSFVAKLLPRLTPHGRVIIINTRWHHDDLTARLELQGWPILHTPALDDEDKSYWPEYWTAEKLRSRREEIGSREFETQYQGRPTADVGNILKWFPTYDRLPELRETIHRWDTAWSAKQTADFSACVSLGVGVDNNIYVLSGWQDRLEVPELCEAMIALYELEKPDKIIVEQTASAERVVKSVKARTMLPIFTEPVPKRMDKTARVNAASPYFEAGRVLFPARYHRNYGPWVEELIEQAKQFPYAQHDDWVDALVGGVLRLVGPRGRPKIGRWVTV